MNKEQSARNPFNFVIYYLFFILLSITFLSCEWEGGTPGNRFAYDLQGTWVTHDPGSMYTGGLEISYDRITITGFSETQTPDWWGNDDERPFKDFIKGVSLRGYSEEGHIYIEHMGIFQAGIPYVYWSTGSSWDINRTELLTFTFDGREQTLRKE